MASRGKFIVLEGIDGCGKTTIAKLLARQLKAIVTKEPTRTGAAGKQIHAILQHRESAPPPAELQKLYIADRKAHLANVIRPALAKGKTVICQRYAMSTYAYGMAFGVPPKKLVHRFLKPDLTILLDLPVAMAMKRIASRKTTREYFEKQQKLARIRQHYLKLAKKFNAVVVDARPRPEVIATKLWTML